MSIETVLSWPAFADQCPNTYLKSLVSTSPCGHTSFPRVDVIHQDVQFDDLLQRFLDHVYIYNPVIEETTLNQYVREVEYHGFKFDAKSCLLVRNDCLRQHQMLTSSSC